jgi:hypothetical protein
MTQMKSTETAAPILFLVRLRLPHAESARRVKRSFEQLGSNLVLELCNVTYVKVDNITEKAVTTEEKMSPVVGAAVPQTTLASAVVESARARTTEARECLTSFICNGFLRLVVVIIDRAEQARSTTDLDRRM